jgi:hypothetical protein
MWVSMHATRCIGVERERATCGQEEGRGEDEVTKK